MSDAASSAKPRKLGRGLAALLGAPVEVVRPGPGGAASGAGGSGGGVGGGYEQEPQSGDVLVRGQDDNRAARVGGAEGIVGEAGTVGTGKGGGGDGSVAVGGGREAGRGAAAIEVGGRVMRMVGVGAVVVSPFQPRREFDGRALAGLAESIKAAGVMQPILVRAVLPHGVGAPVDGYDRNVTSNSDAANVTYELVAGERRWRAAKLAGLAEVPAVVATLSDEEAAQWSLVENVQRENLGVVERAQAYENLSRRFGMTQAQIAERVGVDRVSVSNTVRLLELEPEVLTLLSRGGRRDGLRDETGDDGAGEGDADASGAGANESGAASAGSTRGGGGITGGHAKVLMGMQPGAVRVRVARAAAAQEWSVRALEEFVRANPDSVSAAAALDAMGLDDGGSVAGGAATRSAARDMSSELEGDSAVVDVNAETEGAIAARARLLQLSSLERELSDYLGTKVEIKTNKKGSKGKVVISFYGVEQFEGLRMKMVGK